MNHYHKYKTPRSRPRLTLKSGESLLLGGFVQDRDETTQNKIPLLGDLPLLGGLFRSTDHHTQSVMRLFLIKAEPVNQGD
ncbi:hypothetical protein P4S55_01260 [Shewanella sp. PP-Sp27a-2]